MEKGFITPEGHVNFLAKKLFEAGDGFQGRVQWGAAAYIAQGGGGPQGGHTHPSSHIFVVTEGKVRVMLDGAAHTVEKDQAFFVPGGVPHSIWNDRPETAKVIKINLE